MSNESNNPKKVKNAARSGTIKMTAILAATTMLIGASFGVQAIAESKMYQHAKLYMSDSNSTDGQSFVQKASWSKHDGKKGGKHRGGHQPFSQMSDEEIEKKITRVVKHVSIEIDATDEQETKITTLVTALAKDMKPLHGEFKMAGEELRKILTSDTIDRVALEKLRAERVAKADRVSKELVSALADVAEVLTSEQRAVLSERIEQFKSMRGRWHRG
jgi:protein CpxP